MDDIIAVHVTILANYYAIESIGSGGNEAVACVICQANPCPASINKYTFW